MIRLTVQEMVTEFHRKFSVAIAEGPTRDLLLLRQNLIIEEANEAVSALGDGDLLLIAQELADLVYVTYGTAISLGINLDVAIAQVHRANMSKLGANGHPILRSDGKVLKPPGWSPPDMTPAVPKRQSNG